MLLRVLNEEKIINPEDVEIVLDDLLMVLQALNYENLIKEHLELIDLVKQKQPALNKKCCGK